MLCSHCSKHSACMYWPDEQFSLLQIMRTESYSWSLLMRPKSSVLFLRHSPVGTQQRNGCKLTAEQDVIVSVLSRRGAMSKRGCWYILMLQGSPRSGNRSRKIFFKCLSFISYQNLTSLSEWRNNTFHSSSHFHFPPAVSVNKSLFIWIYFRNSRHLFHARI